MGDKLANIIVKLIEFRVLRQLLDVVYEARHMKEKEIWKLIKSQRELKNPGKIITNRHPPSRYL